MFEINYGDYEEGCRLYETSIKHFKSKNIEHALSVSQYFYAEQLTMTDKQKATELKKSALKLAKKNRIFEICSSIDPNNLLGKGK